MVTGDRFGIIMAGAVALNVNDRVALTMISSDDFTIELTFTSVHIQRIL